MGQAGKHIKPARLQSSLWKTTRAKSAVTIVTHPHRFPRRFHHPHASSMPRMSGAGPLGVTESPSNKTSHIDRILDNAQYIFCVTGRVNQMQRACNHIIEFGRQRAVNKSGITLPIYRLRLNHLIHSHVRRHHPIVDNRSVIDSCYN